MDDIGLGAGLAALAFWGFVAAAVVATTWNSIRRREAQQETLRRVIESGQPIDGELLKALALAGSDADRRPDREFQVTGLWLLPVAAGLLLMALILGIAVPDARYPLLGAAALVLCLGVGYLIAARVVARWYEGDRAEG